MRIPQELRWKPTGRTLGEGGQAQVQEVEDSLGEFPDKYALKALSKGKPPQAYERFHREIATIKKLKHPYIIPVVDSSTPQDGFQYYVMELVEDARPLEAIIFSQESPFLSNSMKSLELFQALAEAILACERNDPKIVHRDLSPANILWVPDGTIRIIDFGVCQVAGEETITLSDEGVGTVNYMAPECESGASGDIGIHSDLYSAGKILWAAVTGNRAFSREKPAFTNKSMTKVFPDNPETWHLHHIFVATIRRDPANRWKSAQEAIAKSKDVSRIIAGGYPPIEQIVDRCPVCGVGSLENFSQSHAVFGNPNPPGIHAVQCNYCGICFAINAKRQREKIAEMELLE